MIEYDPKQSKEIYESLLDSKVDLLEYFLGPDPKKTSYYKKHVKRYRAQSILNDSKVDLMEYFLGPDPKKTTYYKQAVRRKSILNDF